ncbi:MAG: DUF2203 domain-containing protein [Gemmatimonadaceae bacterium]|nr:DUF2203 domain-containing protein [Gemmatimonadaceae bacterium]
MKVFSVDDANRTLPLVRRIVADIATQHARWRDRIDAYETSVPPQSQDIEVEVQQLAAEMQGYVQELRDLGIEVKDFQLGLVDFPGERDGRPVYLCWKLGEPAVQHWHELDTGYADRQPVALTPDD